MSEVVRAKDYVKRLTRVDELIDRYSGCLDTGGNLRERVEGLREEWR